MPDLFNPIAVAGLKIMSGADPGEAFASAIAEKRQQEQLQKLPDIVKQNGSDPGMLFAQLVANGVNAQAAATLVSNINTKTSFATDLEAAGIKGPEAQQIYQEYVRNKASGIDPYQLAQLGLSQKRIDLQSENASTNADLRRGSQELQRMAIEDRQNARQTEQEQKMSALRVPGFDLQDGYMPAAKDADTLKTANQSKDILFRQLDELDELVRKKGTEFGFGTDQSRMEQLATNIMLNAKELENLGVLNGPDVDVLRAQLIDPTSLTAQFRSNETVRKSFAGYKKYIADRVNATAEARGYRAASASEGSSEIPPPAGGLDTMLYNAQMDGQVPAEISEGTIITNGKQRMVMKGGAWQQL